VVPNQQVDQRGRVIGLYNLWTLRISTVGIYSNDCRKVITVLLHYCNTVVLQTWADVVRKPAAVSKEPTVASNARKIPAIPSNGFVGTNKRTKRMSVLKRSLSQNNPVNSIKV
jgi:hypothetical protein